MTPVADADRQPPTALPAQGRKVAGGIAETVATAAPGSARSATPAGPNDHVEWQADAPTTRDVLRRDALAQAIAHRLRRRNRWPVLAAYLAEHPDAAVIDPAARPDVAVTDPAPRPDAAPADLLQLLASDEVRRVLAFPDGTTLTPDLIRRRHGIGGTGGVAPPVREPARGGARARASAK